MTIELSDTPCPDCGADLQVIYATELKQVISGWACPDCGYVASESEGFEDSVPKPERQEYVLRTEKSLSSADVRGPVGDVPGEFRARARSEMAEDEVWMLIDPETEELVDVRIGGAVEESDG